MRVALTGANGFTGRYVAQALAEAGAKCVPLDAELTDKAAIDRAVAETDFDSLIHLAALAFVAAEDWEGFYTVNQLGTFHLLDAVARKRPGARCILASSAQVYGPGVEGLIAETAPTHPANHYAVSKLSMELGAAQWRDRLDIVVTRPFNYTGVGQEPQYLIPKIVDHFRRRAAVIELGNTWVKREFGDVRSVARAYAGIALAESVPALVNIATAAVHSIDEVIGTLSEITGHAIQVRVNPAFVRTNDVAVLGGDPARLRAALPEWRHHSLAETLTWMCDEPERHQRASRDSA
ncbi:GDP-mannose 4,6-dehydratase [Sphingomonas sp. M1-B02]|uniref:GDP-mannose 4,6-dehydratase n=1 Tax=Sphingomonas sp. M1-B02 TaxID=3114300 RepID=UPI00223F445B|nr:GDP-mannose 4,6-dehydratase [Sphingomonas sp. S6-11]UZK65061.1 GDP-mannose 4,6-dehydratase [Sphingomonas sp. S6-11]